MALSPGTRLGTYDILSPLGAGTMGEVYRARDTRLRRNVAVKVLPEAVATSRDRLARFEREARAVAGLNHPNIVVLHSVEEEDGIHFLTMELVEGQSLINLIAPGGLPLSRLLDLCIPLADALAAAHERGVVHRDLKPGNVMVTREDRVKVLDFGLAKMTDTEVEADDETMTAMNDTSITETGRVMGTVPYMAPEQIRGEPVDARSDVFALGIMLFELATGRRPFTGATSADVSSAILRDAPEPLASIRADLPGDLDRVVSRCLEKNPRDRAQSARDVCNELRRVKHALEHGERITLPKPASPGLASIAVLPFVNRSRDEEDEYFSDGLADELLNVLAKIQGLRVVARSSSFTFKNEKVTIAEVGKALNVATVLEGSVRKAGNRVRISVQLVKVYDGYHVWSQTYDRTLDDIFAVQDDIAQSVVKELHSTLLGEEAHSKSSGWVRAEVAMASRGRGDHPEAYRLYLQARHLIGRRITRADIVKGIEYLKLALELDPTFALGWATLGGAYALEADLGWAPAEEGYARGREAVEQALSLDPNLADGHARMGWIQMFHDWEWRGAEESYRRALELAPGNAAILSGIGFLARCQGHVDEAIGLLRRSLEQDPLSASTHNSLGRALQAADRLTEAEQAIRKALELAPQRVYTRAILSLALLAQGRCEEALAEAMREPEEAFRLWALAIIHFAAGRLNESNDAFRDLMEKFAADSAYQIAEVQGAFGEVDAAFEWLDRAFAQRDSGLTDVKNSPYLRSLHGDPRWTGFLKKMGFDD